MLPIDILFTEKDGLGPIFKNQASLAKAICLLPNSPYESEASIRTFLSKIFRGKRMPSKELLKCIDQVIRKEAGSEAPEAIINSLHQAFAELRKGIKEREVKLREKPIRVGAGFWIFSSPIALLQFRTTAIGVGPYEIAMVANQASGKSLISPRFGLHEGSIYEGENEKPLDANDVIELLIDNDLDVACVAEPVFTEWRKKRAEAGTLIKVCTIVDTADTGIQLHVSTKNPEIIKILKEFREKSFFSDEDVTRFLDRLREIAGKEVQIPLLCIRDTLSEKIAHEYLISNHANRLLKGDDRIPLFVEHKDIGVISWEKMRSEVDKLKAVVPKMAEDTFFFTGWSPHINWLETQARANDFTTFTFSFSYFRTNRPWRYFRFNLVIARKAYQSALFRNKLSAFLSDLTEEIDRISDPGFSKEPLASAPLLQMMNINDAASRMDFLSSLRRIRFDIKFFPEFEEYKESLIRYAK